MVMLVNNEGSICKLELNVTGLDTCFMKGCDRYTITMAISHMTGKSTRNPQWWVSWRAGQFTLPQQSSSSPGFGGFLFILLQCCFFFLLVVVVVVVVVGVCEFIFSTLFHHHFSYFWCPDFYVLITAFFVMSSSLFLADPTIS